ncbi:MAG: hypothetical protein PCFJNLEI_03015 [Verrucomicrobiae bacterium]|nr:hypothetical protein [Verrucomicrobiae bacterium]
MSTLQAGSRLVHCPPVRTGTSIINTGCCGFAGAQTAYYRTFSSIEIDSTFYRLPKLATAARWRAAAPPDFLFTLKAWQVITHRASSPTYQRTNLDAHDQKHCGHFGFNATIRWAWDQTYAVAQELGAPVVIFQCPASFSPTTEHIKNLRHFFEKAKRGKLQLGWEPRGNWDTTTIAALCRELDLIHVVDPFRTAPASTGKLQYFRLHGITGPKHRYSDAELRQLRDFCRAQPATYCFFNTLSMAQDAQRFRALTTMARSISE